LLFTSDSDFLPAIEAVQRMGKRVTVLGFKKYLKDRSRLEYVPGEFVDMGEVMKTSYRLKK
jgi:uncharacterized LabA/DUF88 family protein